MSTAGQNETPQVTRTDPPIAPSVRAGNTIYLAGQIADNDDGVVVASGDLAGQARLIFEKIETTLAAEGASLQDIVKMVTYFAVPLDRGVAERYWQVRRTFMGKQKVASTGVQVAALIYPECLIEIEVVAVIDRAQAESSRNSTA